jgi:hypothetical protein
MVKRSIGGVEETAASCAIATANPVIFVPKIPDAAAAAS